MTLGLCCLLCVWSQPYLVAQTIVQESITGPISGDQVAFNISLPEAYFTSNDTYPVIYHLHGLGGFQGGPQNSILPNNLSSAQAMGLINNEYIVVFPNGLQNSMWANSKSGHKAVETHIIQEIIPYVDANYRTRTGRENRFIQGFSMGGYGAATFIAKYPAVFQSAVVYDGALHSFETLSANRPEIITEIFEDDEDWFNEYSPWPYFQENAASLSDSICLRITVGDLTQYNQPFRDSLIAWEVSFEYIETDCAHNFFCLLQTDGIPSAVFHESCQPIVSSSAEPANGPDWQLFPNPSSDLLRVEPSHLLVELRLYDLFGREIQSQPQSTLDVSGLAAGTYIVHLQDLDLTTSVRRIVIR